MWAALRKLFFPLVHQAGYGPVLITCKLNRSIDFSCCDFYEKIKMDYDFLKKDCLQKSMIGRMCKFINASTLFCFLVKRIILVYLGIFTIRIQNSYILQVRYEPYLSDKARCSETSRFLIIKIW